MDSLRFFTIQFLLPLNQFASFEYHVAFCKRLNKSKEDFSSNAAFVSRKENAFESVEK